MPRLSLRALPDDGGTSAGAVAFTTIVNVSVPPPANTRSATTASVVPSHVLSTPGTEPDPSDDPDTSAAFTVIDASNSGVSPSE